MSEDKGLRKALNAHHRSMAINPGEKCPCCGEVGVADEREEDGALMELGEEIADINRSKGWERPGPEDWADNHMIPAKLMLITSEVAEALEAFREDSQEGFEEELADIIIRTIDLGHSMGVDLDEQVRLKIRKNRDREFRHGGKRI